MANSNLTEQERRQLMEEFLQFLKDNDIKFVVAESDDDSLEDDNKIINNFLDGYNE